MRKKGEKIIVMVCMVAMIMTNLPNWDGGADVSGTALSETGDTLVGNARLGSKERIMGDRFIENETLWNDTVITLNGNLTVNETGKLTLDNVTLLMNCTENGSYHIEVESGGEMYILNNSNISSANEYHYLFWVRNDSKFEMRDSELSECGWEWDNVSNRGLIIETGNATIEGSTISRNYVGISLHSSSDSRIIDCNVSTNHRGISLSNSKNNVISGCNISGNFRAANLESSSNNLISDCNLSNNSESGISFWSSSNNTIIKTIISHNSGGIILWYFSENNTITNCEILYNSGRGIALPGSSNNTIENSNISSNGFEAICLNKYLTAESDNNHIMNNIISDNLRGIVVDDYCSGNTIESNKIYSNNGWGIRIWACSENTVSNCTISSNNETGIYLYNSSNNLIVNSTISGNYSDINYHDISLYSNAFLDLLNTTFNKTSVYFGDANSTLNVSWYLNVNVLWNNSIPAEYADVTISDNLTNEVFNGSTDKDGWIKDIVIQEYTQNQTAGKTFFTPHNVTASQGYISVRDDNVTVDETKTVELVLDHSAPEISNTSTVSPEYDENTTVEFSFNVFHPIDLILNCSWYVNNEIKNYTILKNTSTIQPINWSYHFDFMSHGNYTVKVEVFDGNATVSVTWVLTVNDINGRPEITYYYPPKDIVLGSYSYARLNITAYDPDNDDMTYEWKLNGEYLPAQVNKTEYAFSAGYNASENAINTYLIELVITDNGTPPKSVNHTWSVTVVDWNASYDYLLQQIEFLENAIENITELIGNMTETLLNQTEIFVNLSLMENITLLNLTILKYKLVQLFTEIENMNITLKQVNESLIRIQMELDNATAKIGNLTTMLEEANATRDKANETRDGAILDKEDAENETKRMENKMNNAIEAKNKAEYKLGASVVCAVVGGIIAGFFVSFLLRKKLSKKGKT